MNDKELKAYNNGIKEGSKHAEPSYKTLKFMEEQKQAQAVVIERLDNLKCLVESQHKETKEEFDEVKSKQDYTNGRVRGLEAWKKYVYGFAAAITAVAIPLLVYIFWDIKSDMEKFQGDLKTVDKRISDAIERNNNKYFEE